MDLEAHIKERRRERDILLMTHIVIGYPSLAASFEIVEAMVAAGVDLMELQIPFSEPIADGPVILRANQQAIERGISVADCMDFGRRAAERFDIPFLFMTYYNILYKYGVERFVDGMAAGGLQGAIVPDLPPEEGAAYLTAMQAHDLAPVLIFAPTTSETRMRYLAAHAGGLIYCVARKGVTGAETTFSQDLDAYLARCRRSTSLPLAVGFGVKDPHDVEFLQGRADIAVVGSETLRRIDRDGVAAVGSYLKQLRPAA